jgi:hypothetical protein
MFYRLPSKESDKCCNRNKKRQIGHDANQVHAKHRVTLRQGMTISTPAIVIAGTAFEARPEHLKGGDDCNSDASGDKAVLDGSRPGLVVCEAENVRAQRFCRPALLSQPNYRFFFFAKIAFQLSL